jgi:integrase
MDDLLDGIEDMIDGKENAEPFAEGEMLFADWLDVWMREYKLNSVGFSTYESYRLAIENHVVPKLGRLKLNQITPEHLQTFINSRMKNGISSACAIKMKNIINAALKQAVKNRMIPYNPTDAITPPKLRQKEIRVFSPDEQARFMDALRGHRLEALYSLALASGMRKGELLGLTWDCIDFDKQTISVKRSVSRSYDPVTRESAIRAGATKTRSGQRQIPMLSAVDPVLLAHRDRQEIEKRAAGSGYNSLNLVFCSKVGTYIETRRLNITLNKLLKKAKIEHINFHALRHTFATRALESGIPAKVVAEILGHSDVALTLNTYSHVLQSTAHEQMNKLNHVFQPEKTSRKRQERDRSR